MGQLSTHQLINYQLKNQTLSLNTLSPTKKLIFHLPWILWVLVISVLSFIPGNQLPEVKWEIISVDTVAHFGMYLILSCLLALGFISKNNLNFSNLKMYLILVLVGIAFGFFVELIQGSFIYRRYFDVLDVLANSVGTIFGMFLVTLISRKLV